MSLPVWRKLILLIFIAVLMSSISCLNIRSSCDYTLSTGKWRGREVGAGLRSWLASLVTVPGEGPVTSHLYDRENNERYVHVVGRSDGIVQQAGPSDRYVVTVVREATPTLPALAWQWVSRYKIDGMLYGQPDESGRLSGPNITFVYPDFQTALHGTFDNGRLVEGVAVRITGRRCRGGIMELRLHQSRHENPLPWRRESFHGEYLRPNARRMDPFERRAVYAAPSFIPGANEGVFAKRPFVHGELVSYFVGFYTKEADFLFDNLTSSEYEVARAYYFNLGSHSPKAWGLERDIVMDMPPDLRSVATFRTTLGHKINHKFDGNTEFDIIFHPVYGPAACIIAKQEIAKGEELYVNYNYRIKWAPDWYKAAYKQFKKARGEDPGDEE